MSFKPLTLATEIHNASQSSPIYPKTIKNSKGEEVVLGDPAITRALVALMDLSAVNGGAASHWGGPAAIAECMSALHGIMFRDTNWSSKYNLFEI